MHQRSALMRTKWGVVQSRGTASAEHLAAKKPSECLYYIVLHELTHLLEPDHGPRFVAIMDKHKRSWRRIRDRLNRLPTGPESWADQIVN